MDKPSNSGDKFLDENSQLTGLLEVSAQIGVSSNEVTTQNSRYNSFYRWNGEYFSIPTEGFAMYLDLFKKHDVRFHVDAIAEHTVAHSDIGQLQVIARHSARLGDEQRQKIADAHNGVLDTLLAGNKNRPVFTDAAIKHGSYLATAKILHLYLENPDGKKPLDAAYDQDIKRLISVPEHKASVISVCRTLGKLGKDAHRSQRLAERTGTQPEMLNLTRGMINDLTRRAVELESRTIARAIDLAKLPLLSAQVMERKFGDRNRILPFLDQLDRNMDTLIRQNDDDYDALNEALFGQLRSIMEKLVQTSNKMTNLYGHSDHHLISSSMVIGEIYRDNILPMREYRESVLSLIALEAPRPIATTEVIETSNILSSKETGSLPIPEPTGNDEAISDEELERLAAIEELRTQGLELVAIHEELTSSWRFSRKALKQLGLSDHIKDLVVGNGNILPGTPQDKAIEHLSTIITLSEMYRTNGAEKSKEDLSEYMALEQGRLETLQTLHERFKALTHENGYPRITQTITEDIEWMTSYWPGIEQLIEKYPEYEYLADAISNILTLERSFHGDKESKPETTNNNLSPQEQAEFERLEAEELARIQAEEAEFTRLIEEENMRRLTEEAEEARLLAELEAEQEQAERTTEQSIGEIAISLPDPELMEIAEELEFEVFPKGATMEQIRIAASRINPHQDKTDWDRIRDLKRIADQAENGELYISRSTLQAGRTPYYVAVFDLADEKIAVAENPVEGNATYIIRESLTPGNWQEVLRLPKRLARQVGAAQTVHRNGKDHVQKIMDRIQKLLTIKHYQATSQHK